MTTGKRQQAYEEMLSEHRLTWKFLNGLANNLMHRTNDLLDDDTALETWRPVPPYEYMDGRIVHNLRLLHLLRVPLHYDTNGSVYIIRQECSHILFPQGLEDGVIAANAAYETFTRTRKGKAKDAAETRYQQCEKYLIDTFPEQCYFSEFYQQWEIRGDDNGYWLADLKEMLLK